MAVTSFLSRVRLKILEIFLIALAILEFYPFFMIIADAFKTRDQLAVNPFGIPFNPTFDNLVTAFTKMKFYKTLFNSVAISVISIAIIIIFASMASYPLSRIKNKFTNFIYLFFLAGIMIPYQLAMIPLYKLGVDLHFVNTYHGIIMIYIALFMSFPVFIFTGFVQSVPVELEESACIDGCGKYRTFWQILFPLLKPATATVAVLNILNIWNDFAIPLLFLQRPAMRTVTVALYSFKGEYYVIWPLMFAGVLFAILPMVIFFLFMQKYFISGITAGAIKG